MDSRPNVFAQIGSEYYTFTASEKKLADYILSAQDCISRMSISELAEACSVADATVSRFCRRLGYRGFPDFKIAIANASAGPLVSNPLSGEIIPGDSLEVVTQKLLTASSSVLCMGQGGSMLIASEAAHLFSTVSGKFHPVSDSHMQAMAAAMMEPTDTILFFSFSGSTLAMLDTLKTARARRARVILVTRFPNSPGAALADIVLQCGANENPQQSGSVPARIAQLYLTDILFSEYTRKNLESAREGRTRIAQALAGKHA